MWFLRESYGEFFNPIGGILTNLYDEDADYPYLVLVLLLLVVANSSLVTPLAHSASSIYRAKYEITYTPTSSSVAAKNSPFSNQKSSSEPRESESQPQEPASV